MSAPQPKPNLRALLSDADLFTLDFSPTDQDWEIYAALQNGLNHALKEQWQSYQAKPAQAIFQRYTTGTALHRNQCVCRDMTQLFHQFLQENPQLIHPYMYLIPGSFRYPFMDQNIPRAKMTMNLKYFIQWQGTLEELPPGLVELKEITRPNAPTGLTLVSYYQLAKKTLKRLKIGPFDPTVRGYLKNLLPDFAKFEMGSFQDPAWLAEMTQLTNAKLAELGQPFYVAHAQSAGVEAPPNLAEKAKSKSIGDPSADTSPASLVQTLEDWAGYLYNGRKGPWPFVYIANLQAFATLTEPPTAQTLAKGSMGALRFVSSHKNQAELMINFNPAQHPKDSFANISLEELAEKVYGDKEMKYLLWAANIAVVGKNETLGPHPVELILPQAPAQVQAQRKAPKRAKEPFNLTTGEISYGNTLEMIAKLLSKKYRTTLTVAQLAQANQISDPNQITAGKKIILPETVVELRFDGSHLTAYDLTYNYTFRTWRGVSGRPGKQDKKYQHIEDQGPLPEGWWTVDPKQYQNYFTHTDWMRKTFAYVGVGNWRGGVKAWGFDRTWIFPEPATNTFGRANFSIHGGKDPGSAGCIDLTKDNINFQGWLLSKNHPIRMRVQYP